MCSPRVLYAASGPYEDEDSPSAPRPTHARKATRDSEWKTRLSWMSFGLPTTTVRTFSASVGSSSLGSGEPGVVVMTGRSDAWKLGGAARRDRLGPRAARAGRPRRGRTRHLLLLPAADRRQVQSLREEVVRVAFPARMGTPTETALSPGIRLAHYEIRGQLGSGAMGTVYRAHDTSLDRDVAVKVLRSRLAEDPAVVDRFVRESRAAARVNHPNLTHIYFVGNADAHADSAPRTMFFAMEYVPGATFEQDVAANGAAPIGKFVDMIVQAARGLAAAHGAGVVHRDVKPSNLMVLPDGTVKVTDFGLAKSLGGDVEAAGGGMLLGTPTFMSPEQCRGRGVDARTDVYALGLTAWFLLAGKPPYASESLGQMIQDQMNSPLPSIRDLRPELPPALERALAHMCEKDPQKRPATMEEVAGLFEPFRPRPLELATFMSRAFACAIDLTFVTGAASVVLSAALIVEDWLKLDVVPDALWAP